MIRLKVKLSKHGASGTLRLLFLLGSIISSPLEAATTVYPLSYSARLTDGNGSPLEGLIDVDVKFFATESSTTLLGQNFLFTGVALNQGVLTLSINMMDSQVAAVFGDGSEVVYIELTADGKTYPRQRYSFVPLALRVPIDQKTLSFDPNGKLGISLKTQPGTNQFLTKNGNGELTWGSPAVVTASSIQGKTVSSTTPQAGQILTYSGSEWIPQTPVNGSGSGTLSVGLGGTGATSFTNNGVLIGAGAGPISATVAGTQENVLKVGASGPEFGKVNLASAEAVTGKLALANGGTGSDLTTTGGSGQYVKQSTTGGPLSVGTIQPEDITTALGSMLATATASGTGPGWSASGNTHTLSIPMASNAGVAAGLLSNGDYATFASKLGSVSAGTGITASPSGSSVTLGLDTVGTAGTYAKVTTDAYGRVVSGATLSTSDLPPLTAMVGASGSVGGQTGAVPAPAANDDAKFLRGDGTWSTPPATAGGSANEIQYNSSGVLTGNSSFVYAAGNVGIGSTSPGAALDISGQIKIQGGSPGVGKVLTSDADGLATWSTAAVGSITGVTAGTGLTGGGTSGSVTLSADVGITANKLVQLDASAKLPAVDGSALTNLNPTNFSSAVSVSKGGTGLTSGTSGGIPYFNAASTMASSAALTANGVVLGGGAGATPTSTAAGAANSVLRVPSGGGAPSFGAIDVSQSNAVTGTLNLGNGGTGTSLLLTGGTGQYLKQSASGAAVTVGTIAATDLPTMVGDSGSGGTKGVVPAPASGDTAAGKFLRADGSWSVPTGTTNWAAPGTIGSTTPNTGAFTTLTASGNVGIGTATPAVTLAVAGAQGTAATSGTAQTAIARFETNSANGEVLDIGGLSTGQIWMQVTNRVNLANTYPLAIQPNGGNVGIGTSAPSATLQVNSSSGTGALITRSDITSGNYGNIVTQRSMGTMAAPLALDTPRTFGGITFSGYDGSVFSTFLSGPGIYGITTQGWTTTAHGSAIYFQTTPNDSTTAAERMRIDQSGNVGIGTTSPGQKLDVNGAIRANSSIVTSSSGANWFGLEPEQGETPAHSAIVNWGNNRLLQFQMGAPYTSAFSGALVVGSNNTETSNVPTNGLYSLGGAYFGGNVGIGTTAPAAKLDVAGTIAATNLPQSTTANVTTGSIVCDATDKTMTAMNFSGSSGQKVEIQTVHNGRLNATGHFYSSLYLDGTLVDSGGVFAGNTWRSQVVTFYAGTLSSSGTHTVQIKVNCGSGATSMSDAGGEWPNGGLHYRVWVGG